MLTYHHKAFTMIELVFVIVIIGILSSIAVPKLNTTRTSAKMTVGITDLTTCIKGIQATYIGSSIMDDNTEACNNIKTGAYRGCWTLSTSALGELNVTASATTTEWCIEAQAIASDRDLNGTHNYGGTGIY